MQVNDIFTNNFGTVLKIVSIDGKQAVVETQNTVISYKKLVTTEAVSRKYVKTPYCRSVFGVGYLGEGPFCATYLNANGRYRQTSEYLKWAGMLKRCYNDQYLSRQPTYLEAVVCEDWHNFQVFAEWCQSQKGFNREGFELDKDISEFSDKVYCPESCSFVPKIINSVMATRGKKGKYLEGVEKNPKGSRYFAHIGKGGQRLRVGTAASEEDAYELFRIARQSYIHSLAESYKNVLEDKTYTYLSNYKAPSLEEAVVEWERVNGKIHRLHVLPKKEDLE